MCGFPVTNALTLGLPEAAVNPPQQALPAALFRETTMINGTAALRRLLAEERFIDMPVACDPLGGRLIESLGFKTVYNGGFATGGSRAISEPLLTLDEQVRSAGDIAKTVGVPVIADAGAGFGEPLHTMRTVKEFIHAGIAGIHIEDLLFPKRAHYHKYVAHVIPREDFVDKIKFACRQRDETDKDFVIIARSDSCRFEGLEEAVARINLAADVGADMGMIFPRTPEEMAQATKLAKIPLVYVRSFGNRDNRPTPNSPELAELGYKACIDALLQLLVGFHYAKQALTELKKTGGFRGLTQDELVTARHDIETLVGLERFYEIEEETVEEKRWGKR
jgi:2-methylisocitrate lyase-like PEP mutase family enzyme